MGAPVDIKVPKEIIDPVIIAQMEYDQGVIPIDIVDRENKWLLKTLQYVELLILGETLL